MEITASLRAIFDAMTEGINIIDTEGRIVFANLSYTRFLCKELGRDVSPVEGRILRDLRPGARLPDVVRDGKPIMHAPRQEQENIYFVNMYPIYAGSVIEGGISIVTFVQDAFDFRKELEDYERRNKLVIRRLAKATGIGHTFDCIIAVNQKQRAVKQLAQKLAVTDSPILLEAESGTGKEVFARSIHNASARRHGMFVAVNCANFNPNILESELFGYVEGAFTGAKKSGKIGLFEAAREGTLFLDEISEMDTAMQAKLLRALQEKRIRPVGAVNEIETDVRLIAASNADLAACVRLGTFRKDLYYRLNAFCLRIPPLRERPEDIPALTHQLLDEFSRKRKRSVRITDEAVLVLQQHTWPGNVRELRNVLEFSAFLAEDDLITADNLPPVLLADTERENAQTLPQRVKNFERSEIRCALRKYGNHLDGKKRAAEELGISLASLYNKLGKEDL